MSFCSSSSASASFRASLTATSFTPLGVAYLLLLTVVGNDAVDWRMDWLGDRMGRGAERQRKDGRKRRETTIATAGVEESVSERNECRRVYGRKFMVTVKI